MPTSCVVFECHKHQKKGIHRPLIEFWISRSVIVIGQLWIWISMSMRIWWKWSPTLRSLYIQLDLQICPDYVTSIPVNSKQEILDEGSTCAALNMYIDDASYYLNRNLFKNVIQTLTSLSTIVLNSRDCYEYVWPPGFCTFETNRL